jgi:hypothetical protein
MMTIKHTNVRIISFACFLVSLILLIGCTAQTIAVTPSPLPINTELPPTALPTNTPLPPTAIPTIQPFPDLKEWDLLIISDSTNWGVGQYYAKLIEADMNVKVNLHDCWVGSLSIGSVLNTLQSGGSIYPYLGDKSCQRPWVDLVKDAEVMVLYGNPLDSNPPDGSWDIPENSASCVMGGYEGKNLLPGFETYKGKMLKSCAPETWAKYKADLGAVIDEIDKIREGRLLILRMTDFYIAWHPSWVENGLDEICTTCIGYSSESIRQVAAEHGVPVADTMVGLNGKDYMSEFPAGYLRADGNHPTDAGAQFIASLLQQTGYEYAGK